MNIKFADIALVALIVGSAGVIGWRLLSPQKDQDSPKTVAEVGFEHSQVVSVSSLTTKAKPIRRSAYGHWAHMVLDSQPPVSTEVLSAFSKSAGVDAQSESSACSRNGSPVEIGLPVLSEGLKQKIETRRGGLLLSYGNRRCYKQGSAVEVLYFGDKESEYYVERLGNFEITNVVELNYAKVAPATWLQLGIDAADFKDLKNPTTHAVLLRVERKGPSSFKDSDFPTYHFRYRELTKQNASHVLKGEKVFLDLRSKSEASLAPIPNAILLEYSSATLAANQYRFNWDTKLAQLVGFNLEVAPILKLAQDPALRTSKVIVIGKGHDDGRIYWILRELSIAGISDAYWYNGDASELTPLLTK